MYKKFIFIPLFLCLSSTGIASSPIADLYVILNQAITPLQKSEAYHDISIYYLEILNNESKFDSICKIALAQAEGSFDVSVILKTNIDYLQNIPFGSDAQHVKNVIARTLELGKRANQEEVFNIWLTVSAAYLKIHDADKANNFSLKAISHCTNGCESTMQILAQLSMGKSLEYQRDYIAAYQQYMNASYNIELLEDQESSRDIKIKCFDYLFTFYQKLKNYDAAAKYKNDIIKLSSTKTLIDSTRYYWDLYDLAGLSLSANRHGLLTQMIERLLTYAKKQGNVKLKQHTLALYRSFLLDNNQFKGFENIYVNRYPEEFSILKKENLARYYQIKAYIHESNARIDSALLYYEKAKSYIGKSKNDVLKSKFYSRYGEFELRNNNYSTAYQYYKKAFEFAANRTYTPYIIESTDHLARLAYDQGRYQEAYQYQKFHHEALLVQNKSSKQDELLKIKLENESKQLKILQRREKQQRKKKHDLQYFIITVGILFLFLLMIILSRVSVPEWIVKGVGFISVLMFFEFIILLLDNQIHHLTHGAPLYIFIIKILILSVLFPLHHIIEKALVNHLVARKQIWTPNKKSISKILHFIWPWLKKE